MFSCASNQRSHNLASGEVSVTARSLLEATGAALLLLLPYIGPLLFPGYIALYHHHLHLVSIIGGLLLNLLEAFLLGVIFLAILSRLSPFPRRIAGACLAGLFLLRFVGTAISIYISWAGTRIKDFTELQDQFIIRPIAEYWARYSHSLAIVITLLLATLAWVKPGITHPLVRSIRLALAAFAFSAFWVIPQLLYFSFYTQQTPSFDHTSSLAESNSSRRIVWILLDELSYNLIFDHPPAGQSFPNLQELRSSSTSFDNIKPVGTLTERIIPSLLAGQRIDQISSASNGKLLYQDQSQNQWLAYDPKTTLFGLAQMNGWNPGVAGWYNPYCRIFADVLAACTWRPSVVFPLEWTGASEEKSVFANSLVLPRHVLAVIAHTNYGKDVSFKRFSQDYRGTLNDARTLIDKDKVRFLFLHMPVPHPPGIYNRNTHQFAENGNYLDNLTLADDTLGALLHEINQTPSADQTTVIVSSDHSWRVPMWRVEPGWTSEEERITKGKFDQRPVFMIHFPGQNPGKTIADECPELLEHDIIAAMLQGNIRSQEDLLSAPLVSKACLPSDTAQAR
jgi:hypothetical protein